MGVGIIFIAICIVILLYNLLIKNAGEKIRQTQYKLLHQEVTTVLLFESSINNKYLLNQIPNPTTENIIPDKLLGKIKILTEKHFRVDIKISTTKTESLACDLDDRDEPHCKIVEYNEYEKISKFTLFNKDGAIIKSTIYNYLDKNLLANEYEFNEKNTTTKYYYDEHDRIAKSECFLTENPNAILYSKAYKYDNLGNCIRLTSQQYRGHVNCDNIIYYFNESELKGTWVNISTNPYALIAHNFYKIGEDQKVTLVSRIEYDRRIKSKIYNFDDNGRTIKKIGFDEGETAYTIIYEYNSESIAINIKEYDRKSILIKEIFCDDRGNKLKEISHNLVPTTSLKDTTFEYIYDQNGNWIERKEKPPFETQVFITRREIIYYP